MQGYASYTGGPVGYGDPDSKYISDGERGNILSKFVQEKLISELCLEEWKNWRSCLRKNRDEWFCAWKCKPVYKIFDQCQIRYLQNPEQVKKFEEEYLNLRSEYRKTGVGHAFMTKERIRELCEL
ncbi:COX assembly mitochondrial isoform 1 [Schistosoma japonicum]|uniref:COX assembly mitochondrial isoform 1 n=1 Tax=Schistosoma japonicum TaxID=6182 RepID=A0A4Z2DJN5_SCHJA|nr:COX assembly mitochondrial isoform 1 [Schistosoma japonicum]TNN16617.1 COX assembly mitochondrial isoform 1 [Schistosoma japonicum]TNN16618.1 COX assembly mitochondrial isoform 1 [Schistosoma japonicum]